MGPHVGLATLVVAIALGLLACQPISPPPAAPTAPAAQPTLPAPAATRAPASTPVMGAAPATAAPTPNGACQFVLGFAQFRAEVGASIVGDCLESEHQIQGTDDSAQQTTNGVLRHRDIDNRDLFSNVSQTWINGPTGLVTRPNDRRFEWEGDRQLIDALRGGGYVVYFRHGATDPNQADADPNNLANCATQRNLTDAGRAQARSIGEAFRALSIPVGTVFSSEYCRALEYSRLAFNKAQPEPSLDLTDPLSADQKAQSAQTIKRLVTTPPDQGTNAVLVSHSPNIRLAADVDLPVEGEAVVFRVDASGAASVVTRVLPTDWPVLAQALAQP